MADNTTIAFRQFALPANEAPMSSLGAQGQAFLEQNASVTRSSNRMLSMCALVLSLALATVLFMLFTTTPASAMTSLPPYQAAVAKADGLVALAALASLCAASGLGFVLIRQQLRPIFCRK